MTGVGSYVGKAVREFAITGRSFDDKDFEAVVANQKYAKNQSTYSPKPVVTYAGELLAEDADYTLEYENNTDAATAESPVKITIQGKGNYSGTKVLTFCVLKESLQISKITVQKSDLVYDGTAKEPAVTVTNKSGTMKEGEDYELIYQNNVNAGTAKVTIAGIGGYTGSKTASFKITPKALSASGYDIEKIADEEYTGANQPVPSVTDRDAEEELTEKDLVYTYKNNKKPGTATVVMKGKGNYKGKLTATFTIKPWTFRAYDYEIPDCSYTGKKLKPDILAMHKMTGEYFLLKSGVALKVAYSNNKDVGDGAKAVFSPKNKKFFDEDFTEEISFRIEKCNLEDVKISPVKVQKFKKKAVTPKLNVCVGTTKLKASKQYSVSYEDNKEKGIGKATIYPADTAHFTGEQTISFVIK